MSDAKPRRTFSVTAAGLAAAISLGISCSAVSAQVLSSKSAKAPSAKTTRNAVARPKLVVMLVVDQMRADYLDKFMGQWSGGLKRLATEGAWFHDAAYPYAATETCVGHTTISTGAFPATHGMIGNAWWDRDANKTVTCTSDPKAKNVGYGGLAAGGGDSAWRMLIPAFAEELKFQTGRPAQVLTFSLKARAAITLGGRTADDVTWFEPASGVWTTSDVYGTHPFVDEYTKKNPVSAEYGKSWELSLPKEDYLYEEKAVGAGPPGGWGSTFPHELRGRSGGTGPDKDFYGQWQASPFADAYLAKMGEAAVRALRLSNTGETDYLGISFSSLDYIGHAYGPRSWEVQDALVRLDQALGEFFSVLDKEVGPGNYVVALSADHGVAPIPEDFKKSGGDAGWLNMAEVGEKVDKTLEGLAYPKSAIASVAGDEIYFAPGIYDQLRSDPKSMRAVLDAIQTVPGVLRVYRSEEVNNRAATNDPLRQAFADSYFTGRSGDLFVAPKPYWPVDYSSSGKDRSGGTTHGTPYYYDQHVPVLLMGWGIRPGNYYREVTPADIAPTFAQLCGITLSSRDGKVLSEALKNTSSNDRR